MQQKSPAGIAQESAFSGTIQTPQYPSKCRQTSCSLWFKSNVIFGVHVTHVSSQRQHRGCESLRFNAVNAEQRSVHIL